MALRDLLLCLVCLYLTSACAVGTTIGIFEDPSPGPSVAIYKDKHEFLTPYGVSQIAKEEEVVSKWGIPDRIENYKNCKVFTYFDGLTWTGIAGVVVVIPIPLVYPSGRQQSRIYFRDGIAVGRVRKFWDSTRIFQIGCSPAGCGAWNYPVNADIDRKANIAWCN